MSRKFLRPLFSFWDPFLHESFFPSQTFIRFARPEREGRRLEKRIADPLETFDNFFKDQFKNDSSLKPVEREFFEKHFPQKVQKKFNPYEILGLDTTADLEKVKEAYRTNAIKYHPKNDQTEIGKKKFEEISRAFNEIVHKKQTNDYGEDISTKNLFQNVNEKEQDLKKVSANEDGKILKETKFSQNKETEKKTGQKENEEQLLKGANLFSESSRYEFINGKQKLHVIKMYEKNGKRIKIDRIQESRNDGSVEVKETVDDGGQIKNREFITNKDQKQLGY